MDELKILKKVVFIILLGIILIYCKDNTSTEPQLDSVGVFWNLSFNSDNTAKQTTNLSGSTTSQSGTLSNTVNKLTLNLKTHDSRETGTMVYTYTIEDNLLKFNWLLGDGTIFDSEFRKQ